MFKKIVIWGHKLRSPENSHTHSFVHEAFYRAFKYLGCEVLWLDNHDDVKNLNFDNSLFITEGQVDNKIPISKMSKYVLHNCDLEKYQTNIKNVLNLNTYIHGRLLNNHCEVVDKNQFCFYQPEANYSIPKNHHCDNRTLYQPWATNLLPHEFGIGNVIASKHSRIKKIYWIGSILFDEFRNDDKLLELKAASAEDGVDLVYARIPNTYQPTAVAKSWIAPAIQGKWQVENGYIPCRVFKNISFGRMTPTNSKTIYDLFHGKLVYSNDIHEMYEKAVKWELEPEQHVLDDLINTVKENHTYINRIKNILQVL